LGLSMVYGFVKQSGGHVKIYSEPGHGTAVKIYLPRSTVAAGDQPVESRPEPHGNGVILAVEDDVLVRDHVAAQLAALGYRVMVERGGHDVSVAADGRDGLKQLRAERFDLIITDILMPETDGLEIVKDLRKASGTVPIIAMSGGPSGRLLSWSATADYLKMAR